MQEGVAERYDAMKQFQERRTESVPWPNQWQNWYTWHKGIIASDPWYSVCGRFDEIGETSHLGGLGWFYKECFLNINDVSDLPNEIYEWPDGSPLVYSIPPGNPHAGQLLSDYPEDLIAPLGQSKMISHLADFTAGHALEAKAIRRIYKDMERLRYYVLKALYTTNKVGEPYKGQQCVGEWYKADSGYLNWTPSWTDRPISYLNIDIINEQQLCYGNPTSQGMWEIWEPDWGYYTVPYCGKTGYEPGTYNSLMGSEVAFYALLRLEWSNRYQDWNDTRLGMFRIDFQVNRSNGYAEVGAWDLVKAGYKLINHYNAEIPHAFPANWEDERSTYVRLEKLFPICKMSERTDTTQLVWNKRP